ncbi:hypothetical protein [Leptospira licerasiae]|uniref:Uncharacterized protein n=1 Tax=Leptospira licerasiae str. MMD4847 TaxID=1049971 RepID=A0ABN0HCP9_9LEPT|nr:hypothetical protein [Leptospira licerasiae]EIE01693.1 hypothetical protein LEP1GSC185_3057 [Leptospira licerasiae serovar Varillal str. VAR 010]EJZ43419.1 hypothetical protein LEP1GSC178_2675 [Leptospira licerasiae str. MMD4847]
MSKVFRFFFLLFFLSYPLSLTASEKSSEELLNSFLEWSGHPILTEERIVRNLSSEYIAELKKDSEQSLVLFLKNDLKPDKRQNQKPGLDKLRKDLQNLERFEGVQIRFPEKEWETLFYEKGNFPESYYELETGSVSIRYVFRNLPYHPLPKWGELKLQGNFLLFSESGALLLYKTNPDFPIKDLDIREVRTFFEEGKKHGGNSKNFSENKTELFYFPNHNTAPFYILLLSKILLVFSSFIIFILYAGRFWKFLLEQTRRSHKAEVSFLADKEKAEKGFLSD